MICCAYSFTKWGLNCFTLPKFLFEWPSYALWIKFLQGGVNLDTNLMKILNLGTVILKLFILGPNWLTNCMEQSASEGGSSLDNQICTIYGTCRFITVFTRTCHLSVSWAALIQSTSIQPISLFTQDHSNYVLSMRHTVCYFRWLDFVREKSFQNCIREMQLNSVNFI